MAVLVADCSADSYDFIAVLGADGYDFSADRDQYPHRSAFTYGGNRGVEKNNMFDKTIDDAVMAFCYEYHRLNSQIRLS